MSEQDYGQFVQRMRKSRGYTQEQLADAAGVSTSTVTKLEASGDQIILRDNNLDAILTAMAQRAPLGGSEIQTLVHATGRKFESIEALNDRAEQLRRAAMAGPTPRSESAPTLEQRLGHAVHQLIAAGHGEMLLVQLEAMANAFGQQIAEHQRTARPTRKLRVRHAPTQIGGMEVEEIAHYEVNDDTHEVREKRPITDPDKRVRNDDDTDTMNQTGS